MTGRGSASTLLLILVLLLAGCGADDNPADQAAPSATSTSTPATASARAPSGPRADITAAKKRARATGRRVLIDFGADWCPDCHALDALYKHDAVAPTLESEYVLVRVDVGRFDKNMDLSRKYDDAAEAGIPALVVLEPDGTQLTSTSDGSFATARGMTPRDVRAFLKRWAA